MVSRLAGAVHLSHRAGQNEGQTVLRKHMQVELIVFFYSLQNH